MRPLDYLINELRSVSKRTSNRREFQRLSKSELKHRDRTKRFHATKRVSVLR